MRILITGGCGFIGSNFILYWHKNHPEDSIVNIDAVTYAGDPENLEQLKKAKNYQFVHANICDTEKMLALTKDIDIVVHFAAETHVDRSIQNPTPFVQSNIFGTVSLLEAARINKIKRFHHVSTDEVYGALPLDSSVKFTEQTAYAPRSPYAASKAASDHLVRAYFHTFNLPITISNSSNNFGPFQYPEKIIPLFITNLLEEKKVPIYGDGLYMRDWLYVEDHCLAIDLILKKGKVGETYLVGADNELSNIALAKKLLELLKKDESFIEYVQDRPGHDRRYALESTKIHALGWKPGHNFGDALQKTVQWYKENQEWWKKLKYKKPS